MPRLAIATRVQLICPAGTNALKRAAIAILELLKQERAIQTWGGFTYSSLRRPVFTGQFWDVPQGREPHEGHWEEDQNVLIMLDMPGTSAASLMPYLADLRERVGELYRAVGQEQKALWITTQPLRIVLD